MKLKTASRIVLFLALASMPAFAQFLYDNGPINGTTDAWAINFGYIVSDTFVGGGDISTFAIGVWEFPGDTMTSLQWSITSGENSGATFGSGTASGFNLSDSFISINQYGYDIDQISVTGLNVSSNNGTKYWLNLQNAAVPSGDPVFWDENSGGGIPPCAECGLQRCHGTGCPSQASESAVGTIPSEAFTIGGECCALQPGGGAPEPSSIVLFGSGVLGLVGILRRKLNF
jgi:PEP-CTERM motif